MPSLGVDPVIDGPEVIDWDPSLETVGAYSVGRSPQEIVESDELRVAMRMVMRAALSGRNVRVLSLCEGLPCIDDPDGGDQRTFAEVARMMGVSSGRIRERWRIAIDKVRAKAKIHNLDGHRL